MPRRGNAKVSRFDFVENCRIADCVARMAEIRHCLLGSACIRMPSRHRSVQLSETRTTQTHPDTGKTVGVTIISLSSFTAASVKVPSCAKLSCSALGPRASGRARSF